MIVSNEVRTRTSVSHLDMHGIVHTIMLPGIEEKLADAQETVRAGAILRAGRRLPVLVDIRGQKSQDRDARQYYGGPEMTQSATAIALIVGSRVSRLIATFYITITKTQMPTKIFTDETEALAWLKGFVQ